MSRIRSESRADVAVLHWDDGKANTISPESLAELNAALDEAEKSAKAVVLSGRSDRFCAGFDLKKLGAGGDATRKLVRGGGELLMRLYGSPLPIVAACDGHALGMGALILLASDTRIGGSGTYKIATNEMKIQLALPTFATVLGEDRLSRRHITRAAMQAEFYSGAGAVDAGFLDSMTASDRLVEEAVDAAQALAEIGGKHYTLTKQRMRGASIETVMASLDAEFGPA